MKHFPLGNITFVVSGFHGANNHVEKSATRLAVKCAFGQAVMCTQLGETGVAISLPIYFYMAMKDTRFKSEGRVQCGTTDT